MIRGTWSKDGKYLIYGTPNPLGSDLWALSMQTGWLHRSTKPIRLTTGALFFKGSTYPGSPAPGSARAGTLKTANDKNLPQ